MSDWRTVTPPSVHFPLANSNTAIRSGNVRFDRSPAPSWAALLKSASQADRRPNLQPACLPASEPARSSDKRARGPALDVVFEAAPSSPVPLRTPVAGFSTNAGLGHVRSSLAAADSSVAWTHGHVYCPRDFTQGLGSHQEAHAAAAWMREHDSRVRTLGSGTELSLTVGTRYSH